MEASGSANLDNNAHLYGPGVGQNEGSITATTIINQGMSVRDAADLFELLFDKNLPKLEAKAEQAAHARVEELRKAFFEQANSNLKTEDVSAFAEPDMQYMLAKAIEVSARRDSKELRLNLASLLVERIKYNENDFLSIALGEAILAIGKLTTDQLMMIALRFMVCHYIKQKQVKTWSELDEYLERYAKPFLGFRGAEVDAQHIGYTGCATINYSELLYGLSYDLQRVLPKLFRAPIQKAEIDALGISQSLQEQLFSRVSDTTFKAKVRSSQRLAHYSEYAALRYDQQDRLRNLIDAADLSDSPFEDDEQKATHEITKQLVIGLDLITAWHKGALPSIRLSPVGLVIAAVYCSQILGEEIDLAAVIDK